MSNAILAKSRRIAAGGTPRVLDLFSGCGGFTLGFVRAGFHSVGGVELDKHASHSHALNFHPGADPETFEAHARPKDILSTDPHELLASYGHVDSRGAVDVLIGGPPCPAFTRVGRAKLREVHDHPEAYKQDPRWRLYLPYLDYVEHLQPLALVMENVPDLMNFGGYNLAEEICETLEDMGYIPRYTLLNASNYGVPQMRERFILFAYHADLNVTPDFPEPTRRVEFPSGYQGTRDVALKVVKSGGLFADGTRFLPTPVASVGLPGPVTTADAIADLPNITSHLDGTMRGGARRFNRAVGYRRGVRPSSYALELRNWPGFAGDGQIWDHVTRLLSDRDFRLFRAMAEGDDYPKAHALAESLFAAEVKRLAQNGGGLQPESPEWVELRDRFVPPYDPGKFPNKWRKMEADAPARTLMAHLGKDSYTHIHYDSQQARVLSVREAARLQSFPDGFQFSGTMNPAFRQIGNAVPPLFSYALGRHLLGALMAALGSADADIAEATA